MKQTITIKVESYTEKQIEVEFPLYCKIEYDSEYGLESTVYYKIESYSESNYKVTKITYSEKENSYTLEIDSCLSLFGNRQKTDFWLGTWEYKSDKKEFDEMLEKFKYALESIEI